MATIREVVTAIQTSRERVPAERALLVALSGIDGSGKGFVSARIVQQLTELHTRSALLHADGWLNLPAVRFSKEQPAEHFYEHAFRFEEMFARLVLPLREQRSIDLRADFTEENATAYRPEDYRFEDIAVIVLEGVFLLKQPYRSHYDLAIWVDCTFETALERSLQRRQEHLSAADTIRAYETIYFPAQRLHLTRDQPREVADLVIVNDPRLEAAASADHGKIGKPD